MEAHSVKRKLAAILAADVKGYSRLMGEDEEATLHTLNAYRKVTDPLIEQHDGRKVSGLFVIARNSAFTYKGKVMDVGEVSRKLGVRYVLEGSVRKAGDQVRITAQLVDATTFSLEVWRQRLPIKDPAALERYLDGLRKAGLK